MPRSFGDNLYRIMLKDLKAVIDADKLEAHRQTRSQPLRPAEGGTG